MLNVFQSTFSCTSNGSNVLCLKNWEESANIWLVLTIQTVMPVGFNVLLLSAKTRQENQRNEASRLRKCIKKSSALSHVKCEEVSLQIEFTTLPPINHNLFVKLERKGNWRNKEMRPQANNAQYNTQGWDVGGRGGVRRQWEGRGGRLLCANLYMSRVKWYDNTYTFQLYWKGTFTYSDSNPRDSRNQEMWRWCSQIASDYI